MRNSTKEDPEGLSYFDPQTGAPATAPIVAADLRAIQWINPAASLPQTIRPITGPPQPALQVGGIGDFLTQPGLLGFPVWTNIAAGVALLFVLSQMDGGTKKKGGGWI